MKAEVKVTESKEQKGHLTITLSGLFAAPEYAIFKYTSGINEKEERFDGEKIQSVLNPFTGLNDYVMILEADGTPYNTGYITVKAIIETSDQWFLNSTAEIGKEPSRSYGPMNNCDPKTGSCGI